VALFTPWSVRLTVQPEWAHIWMFSDINSGLLLVCGAFVILVVAAGAFKAGRDILHGKIGDVASFASCFFLVFFLAAFAVCSFRLFTRGPAYLHESTYYFSYLVFSLCGILSALIATVSANWARQAMTAILAFIAGVNVLAVQSFLGGSEHDRRSTNEIFVNARAMMEKETEFCFAGMDPTSTPGQFNRWTPLLQGLSCTDRPNAMPLYLSYREGLPTLARMELSGQQPLSREFVPASAATLTPVPQFSAEIAYATPFKFTLSNSPTFRLEISGQNGISHAWQVDYNVVVTIGQGRFLTSLPFVPGRQDVSYRIEYTQNAVLFLVNDALISLLPIEPALKGTTVSISLTPGIADGSLVVKQFSASPLPVIAELRFLPIAKPRIFNLVDK